jgi:hypothetical protein
MVQINFAHKEIQCKVVYYGPGMSGKTTNLELVHEKTPKDSRGELTSIATTGERTLYFDYMPLDLGAIAGIRTKFQLYTVPGQVAYNATRQLVLRGVDGLVFVADSSPDRLEANVQALTTLESNLLENRVRLEEMPLVLQYNKRDVPGAMAMEHLDLLLNQRAVRSPVFASVASEGKNVFATLNAVSQEVLRRFHESVSHELSAGAVAAAV